MANGSQRENWRRPYKRRQQPHDPTQLHLLNVVESLRDTFPPPVSFFIFVYVETTCILQSMELFECRFATRLTRMAQAWVTSFSKHYCRDVEKLENFSSASTIYHIKTYMLSFKSVHLRRIMR